MKRIPELRDLSADHHHGLALARKAKQAAAGEGGSSIADVWADIEAQFPLELEPHFQIEESLIAPILEQHGQGPLAKRLYEEHAALRRVLLPGAERTAGALRRFGELLEAHIRFEEREFFEVAQTTLDPVALRAVERATRER